MKTKGFLLDTTALIDFFRGNRETIDLLSKLTEEAPLAACPITVSEVFSGVRPGELARVEEFMEALVFYPISYKASRRAGIYRRAYMQEGISLSLSDTIIASVAIENSLILVTKNLKHFPMSELSVIEH
ncbi:MAG: type II toxin-antitoxin system VapC family toxin [Desulfotomaculaceae bacterium]